MATGSRTLTLKLLADIDNFVKNTNQAEAQTSGFSKTIDKFGAAAKAAFAAAAAAAAAYAVKIGVDGVKAAIEDEQAQAQLARTLKAATGATDDQIAATEKYIGKMQLASGVADTDLRNALSRLALSTNDVTKAQDLLSLALDISKATGKDLDGVANALGKAYDGQNTALGKLGIGLSSAELKTMTFEQTQKRLSDLFGGAAATNAKTFQGQIDILKQRFAEFQEGVGYALLPILTKLFDFINNNLAPAFTWLKQNAIDPVAEAIAKNKDTFIGYYNFIKDNLLPIIGGALMIGIKSLGTAASLIVDAVASAIRFLEPIINAAIDGINLIIRGINIIKLGADIPYLSKMNTTPVYTGNPNLKTNTSKTTSITSVSGITIPTATTNASKVTGTGVSTAVASVAKVIAAQAGGGFTDSQNAARLAADALRLGGAFTDSQNAARINVTVNGAIDPEGVARTIVDTLNSSFYRGTGGAGGLVYAT